MAKSTGAPSNLRWSTVDWRKNHKEVWRLQVRIAKAVRGEKWGKVRSLQYLLTRSLAARLWAVRRVTTNKGRGTPGVDGVVWRSVREKLQAVEDLKRRGYQPKPLRRVYIPKKNQKRRPLSLPTMKDRAMQALHLLAVNPIAETTADRNSYGFRLRRCVADAWGQCFTVLAKRHAPQWIFEGDIESCFDRISHEWLLANTPMDRKILRGWLEAGYLEDATFYRTLAGTPQGGVISPVIANLALDGLEEVARAAAPRVKREARPKVHVIRYADDFVVTAASRELLVERVIPAVEAFLAERGLRLSTEKSRITHVEDGFEFLGAEIRKHGRKLLMQPTKRNRLGFSRGLRKLLRSREGTATWKVVQELNRRIQGWTNFYRCLASSRAFGTLDDDLYKSLWRWIRKRHRSKNTHWLASRYFRHYRGRSWTFAARRPSERRQRSLFRDLEGSFLYLLRPSSVGIRRHIKVRADATPFDPKYDDYFRMRRPSPRSVIKGATA